MEGNVDPARYLGLIYGRELKCVLSLLVILRFLSMDEELSALSRKGGVGLVWDLFDAL